MAILERTYTVPLRSGFAKTPRYRRTNRAVRTLRDFLVRHMKAPAEQIKIGQHLNEFLWQDGIRSPPPRVTITVRKDDEGIVRAELAGKEYAEAVRPLDAQQEPQGLKEKLQAAIGSKKEKPATAADAGEEPAQAETGEDAAGEEPAAGSAPKKKPAKKQA